MALGFRGGIGLDLSVPRALPIVGTESSEKLIYPLPKDFGALVFPGDTVSHDTVIAVHPDGSLLGANVCGSVSAVSAERIEIFANDMPPPDQPPIAAKITDLAREEILDHIRLTGLIAENGHPMWRMLAPFVGKGETLILNAVETDAGVTCKHAMLRSYAPKVLGGLKLLMRLLALDKAVVVMTEHMQIEADTLRKNLNSKGLIDIYAVEEKYPCENPRVLYKALTGSHGAPSEHASVIVTVQDCIWVYEAFVCGRPSGYRTVTVDGNNFLLRLGTPIAELPRLCSLSVDNSAKAYIGGWVGGKLAEASSAVTASVSAVHFAVKQAPTPESCIRCGKCHDVCPVGLLPMRLYQYIEKGNLMRCQSLEIDACIACGACSAVCPSYLPLADRIEAGMIALATASSKQIVDENPAQAASAVAVEEIGVMEEVEGDVGITTAYVVEIGSISEEEAKNQ